MMIWLQVIKKEFQKHTSGGFLQEKLFLKISQNSQGSACGRDYFLIKLQS